MKKNKVLYIIIFVLIGYVFGFLISNYKVLLNDIGIENVENYVFKDNTINIDFNENVFVHKIVFNYSSDELNVYHIYTTIDNNNIELKSGYASDSINVFSDNLNASYENLSISFEKNVNDISDIRIDNNISFFNIHVFISICVFIIIGLLFAFKQFFISRLEVVFVLLALFFGITLIMYYPSNVGISWDDETHFIRSYGLLNTKGSEAIKEIGIIKDKIVYFDQYEERLAYFEYLNNKDVSTEYSVQNYSFKYDSIVYLPFALIFNICRFFSIPIGYALIVCRIVGLLLYIIIIYFAIKKTPILKQTFFMISLAPAILLMASGFSYDPPLLALTLLYFANYLDIIYSNKKIKSLQVLLLLTCIIVGVSCKAVYIPLILVLLTIPKEKFNNRKSEILFKVVILLLFLTIMSTFVNTGSLSSNTGDTRGGDVSVSRQINFILNNIPTFTKVFSLFVYRNITDWFVGRHLFSMAYIGDVKDLNVYYLFIILLLSSLLFENKPNKLTKSFKILTPLLLVITMGMIIASMYLCFTPVGSLTIHGVQPRYFIPLMLPLFLLLFSKKIRIKIDDEKLYYLYSISCTYILTFVLLSYF